MCVYSQRIARGHYEDGQRHLCWACRRGRTRQDRGGYSRGHGRGEQGAGSREQLKGCGGWKLDVIDTYIGAGKPGISFINRMLEWLQ